MLAMLGMLVAAAALGYWLGWDARGWRAYIDANNAWWKHYREMEAMRDRMRSELFDEDAAEETRDE